ncbi:MAG: glycosyltransferase involved in cell wall biosynthesis [Maribacter sp.]|jgi:glycosyltransferase involved in cell wall biosynthesis
MKILRVYPYFQTEFRYLEHYLTDELSKKGYKTTFITSDKINPHWKKFTSNINEYSKSYYENDGYGIHRIKSTLLLDKPFPRDLKRIKKIIEDEKFDVIHFSGIAGFFTYIILNICLKSSNKAPIFINDHSNPAVKSSSIVGKSYYRLNAFVFSFFKPYIAKIISPNNGSALLLKSRYNLDSGSQAIIPLGYDRSIFRLKPHKKNVEQELIIGFAGKLEPRKKLEKVLEAISLSKLVSYKLIIVGAMENDDYTSGLKVIANKYNTNVELLPLISDRDALADFYNYIDVAIYPGSISITTVEATACGTPVIIYKSMPGLEYRVENGRGHLFDTIEELAEIIVQYSINKTVIDSSKIAQATMKFSWENIAMKYNDLYLHHLE